MFAKFLAKISVFLDEKINNDINFLRGSEKKLLLFFICEEVGVSLAPHEAISEIC